MAKGILGLIFTSERVGKFGEVMTEHELKWVQLFGRKGKVLRNVYLPKKNGETSEVDVIFITQKGIFIFESKNYSGWIFGNETSKNWTVTLPNGMKNSFYNPIMQNKTHMKWMKNYVGEDIPLFSIIVFSERCELKKVTVTSEDIKVIKRDRTYATVRSIWDKAPDAVSEEKIEALYVKLKELTNVDKAIKAAHVENIRKKFGNKNAVEEEATFIEEETDPVDDEAVQDVVLEDTILKEEAAKEVTLDDAALEEENAESGEPVAFEEKDTEEATLKCPRCGGDLVLRTAKKGENAGKQFYGCGRFPKCRYIQSDL